MYIMPRLQVAQSIEEIDQAFDSLLQQETPGFQISPDLSLDQSKAHLEERMAPYIDGFQFNHVFSTAGIQRRNAIFHIDAKLARDKNGIALHETTKGTGEVELALLESEQQLTPQVLDQTWLTNLRYSVRRKHVGELAVGVKTVFSEGISPTPLTTGLGPTVHRFRSKRGVSRSFSRYTWDGY